MNTVLHKFISEPLFDATEAMLSHLHISFSAQSKTPLSFQELYADSTSSAMPQALKEVVDKVNNTYLIGAIDEDTLEGRQSDFDIEKSLDGKYQTMLIFAVDIKPGQTLTRSELATLTRGFNRMAPQLPVVVFVKSGEFLSLATCERSEYRQDWREGEKLGKVSILRDINCAKPHRGHIDILSTLGDKAYPTFEELYKHWLEVFSSELLTKKFYTELSEWYAWVIGSGKVKFPNDISTTEDDMRYNHEAVIRLITRLIFVWFLKQKNLIPEDFFNENVIRDKFIENFDPHSTNTLFYNPEESKYYRLILQNLFFAMLNRPIKDEESGEEENRRFRKIKSYKGGSFNSDFNVNNVMRYQSEFKREGDEKLLQIANSFIPFLNGGLFECLDHKDRKDPEYGMYYDGFTEDPKILSQLSFPDYFFFGEEVGRDVDLSKWYDDKKKSHVRVRGLINIFRSYNFTVEENTPLDQEVSLDPELLGKAFENLLASYNPETNNTARKQTGSFYTPRDIVKYMVDESLIAHLKRSCPSLDESTFRNLFDYSVGNFDVPEIDRKAIMSALYNCKVLDPACGSGAFPMGMLQQMVHALRKLDPTNEMWREFILEMSLKKDKEAYQVADEEERNRLRADIEQSFNRQVNDPDYARKLYLIENCIYGVDIQPIATQISKLRFFISLVAEQKPKYDDPINNFGIRPLPNLEAKFVSANTLVNLDKNASLFTIDDEIKQFKAQLAEANHKNFLAKRNKDKRIIRDNIRELRKKLAAKIERSGVLSADSTSKVALWDMFAQNTAANFFDIDWMFGIKDGFDVVIGNPPYIRRTSLSAKDKQIYEAQYASAKGQYDIYLLFIEFGIKVLKENGVLCFINPLRFFNADYGVAARTFISNNCSIRQIIDVSQLKVFQSAMTYPCVLLLSKVVDNENIMFVRPETIAAIVNIESKDKIFFSPETIRCDRQRRFLIGNDVLQDIVKRLEKASNPFAYYFNVARGLANGLVNFNGSTFSALKSKQVKRYRLDGENLTIDTANSAIFADEMIIMPRTVAFLQATLKPKAVICLDRIYYLMKGNNADNILPFLGVFNSKLINFWFEFNYWSTKVSGNYFDLNGTQILSVPFPKQLAEDSKFSELVTTTLANSDANGESSEIDEYLFKLFNITEKEKSYMQEFMVFNGHSF